MWNNTAERLWEKGFPKFLVVEVIRLPHKPLWRFWWRCVWLQNIFSSPTAPPGGYPVPSSPPGSQITGIPRCSKLVKALRLKFMCSLRKSFKEHWRNNRSKGGLELKKKIPEYTKCWRSFKHPKHCLEILVWKEPPDFSLYDQPPSLITPLF